MKHHIKCPLFYIHRNVLIDPISYTFSRKISTRSDTASPVPKFRFCCQTVNLLPFTSKYTGHILLLNTSGLVLSEQKTCPQNLGPLFLSRFKKVQSGFFFASFGEMDASSLREASAPFQRNLITVYWR